MKTLVILAGGKSSRMGRDKTFLIYRGQSFLEHMLGKADGLFERVIISAGSKEHAACIAKALSSLPYRAEIVPDLYTGIGPAGGLLSVWEQTDVQQFAVIAVDIVHADLRISAALLDMLSQKESPENEAGKSYDGTAEACAVMLSLDQKHLEACAAAYDRSSYSLLKKACEREVYGIVRALGQDSIRIISPAELIQHAPSLQGTDFTSALQNINTQEDLQEILQQEVPDR